MIFAVRGDASQPAISEVRMVMTDTQAAADFEVKRRQPA
jgi:hypothetical protein